MNLLIVESPAKIKKLESFLGSGWRVAASVGHVCDLPERELGIDLASGCFDQVYEVDPDRKKVVSNLKSLVRGGGEVYLASDPDREGEAISWHVARLCGLDVKRVKRVEFHSITREAVLEAVRKPRVMDLNLVDAYRARRAVDRIFGYQLSPEVQRFNMRSAGRCQTPTLNIVVAREREIRAFVPKVYFSLRAYYKEGFFAEYCLSDGEGGFKVSKVWSGEELEKLTGRLNFANEHVIVKMEKKVVEERPLPPFITSSVITEASSKLGFKPKRTSEVLQSLFQGGYITYIRTDSFEVSAEGIELARGLLRRDYPALLPDEPVVYRPKKSAQGAHECIRPTHEDDSAVLDGDELRLYTLIRKRFLACQCKPAVVEQTVVILRAEGDVFFMARGLRVMFEGYRALYGPDKEVKGKDEGDEDEQQDDSRVLPELKDKQTVFVDKYSSDKKQTKPPSRFKLSTLTKEIERLGIGRPSTFASTVQVPLDRGYYEEGKGGFLFPTELGFRCIEVLESACPELITHEYTAELEESLDDISAGKQGYAGFLKDWYEDWESLLSKSRVYFTHYAETHKEAAVAVSGPRRTEGKVSKAACPECSVSMEERSGKFGKYFHCPKCNRNISASALKRASEAVKSAKKGEVCPLCGAGVVKKNYTDKKTGKRLSFKGCSKYPSCKGILR